MVNHFITSDDVDRSARFYTEVLGGTVVFGPECRPWSSCPTASSSSTPAAARPTTSRRSPSRPRRIPTRTSSFLNLRVKDIQAAYDAWTARGAQFLTPPKQHPFETRCYIRDPDGYLIEVGQTTDPAGDWLPPQWPSATQ